MATIVYTLDKVTEWLAANVCADVNLKPHSLEDQTDDYAYELVHPNVFALYAPTKKTKPPNVRATIPAICVQLAEGADTLYKRSRSIKLHLSFSAWDPGTHPMDVFSPTEGESDIGHPYRQGPEPSTPAEPSSEAPDDAETPGTPAESAPPAKPKLILTHTGWRDVWNFVDVALRAIETPRTLAGYLLDPKTPITFGAYDEDGAISDYYPFWFAWVELALTQEITVAEPSFGDLL